MDSLLADGVLTANARAKEGLEEMSLLFRLLKAHKIIDKVLMRDSLVFLSEGY